MLYQEIDQNKVIQVVNSLGQHRTKGDEIQPIFCPFCHGGEHKDKYTFSFNTTTGLYNCLRGSCGVSGHIDQLCEHLGIETTKQTYVRNYQKPKKQYKKPEVKSKELSDQNIEYFKKRLISETTLRKNKVTTDKYGNIVFNYYRDGEVEFIKYKLPRKPQIKNGKKESKSWREAGARPILYGMDRCDFKKPLIIIEGEPDKLVLDECNVENAVSIPSGTEDFNWLTECWEWLENFNEIIIWGDNDNAGKKFQNECITRLSDWKIRVVKCQYKDANVMLYKKNEELGIVEAKKSIQNIVKNAEIVKKDYITNLGDVKRKDRSLEKPISSGFELIDKKMGGFYPGQLVIWTGFNGSGKSTLLSNIILNGIEQGIKTFAYSGELAAEDFKEWMDLQLSGTKYLTSYDCPIKKQLISTPNQKYYDLLDDFYNGLMYLYDSDQFANDSDVLKAMEYMAKREGTKVFVVDNLLTVNIKNRGDVYEKQSQFINKLKHFARTFNAVVHLVAHPRKPSIGQVRVDKYSVSGTANITDLADRVFGFHRLTQKEREEPEYKGYNNVLMIFKDRTFGVYDQEINFKFDYFSKRYYTNEKEHNRDYSWTKNIDNSPEFYQVPMEDCPF